MAKKKAVVAPTVEVPEEMRKRIHSMARRTWDYIGCDMIQELNGGKDVSRAEVLELVQDAGRMRQFDPEAYKLWTTLPAAQQDQIVGEAFPSKWYGM